MESVSSKKKYNYPINTVFKNSSIIFYECKITDYFPVLFISSNVSNILGFTSEDFHNDNQLWLERIHPNDREKVMSSYNEIVNTHNISVDLRFRHKSGKFIWLRDEIILHSEDDGKTYSVLGTSLDITARKTAEQRLQTLNNSLEEEIQKHYFSLISANKNLKETQKELKARERKYRTFSDLSFDAILEIDQNNKILDCNKSATKIFDYTQEDLVGMNVKSIKPQQWYSSNSFLTSNIASFNNVTWEQTFCKKDGTVFPAEVNTRTYFVDEEKRSIAYIRDISSRKKMENDQQRALKEKETLLSEIHHRVKNNLAVISGLLELQLLNGEKQNLKEVLKDCQSRIYSMAMVHEMLYQTNSFTEIPFQKYIKDFLETCTSSMGDIERVKIVQEISSVSLNVNQAIPCGLILNELITNCFKHAFHKKEKGTINISLESSIEGEVILKVCDNGIGLPDSFNLESNSSLGMKLINTLVNQLQGKLNVISQNGACFEITFFIE